MRDQPRRPGDSECTCQRDRGTLRASAVHAGSHLCSARTGVVSVTDGATATAPKDSVTIVTQTRVRPGFTEAFARWQDETSGVIAAFPGFIDQKVIPPSPPAQDDCVIIQRFTGTEAALAWLRSEQRLNRVNDIAPMLIGRDDVHIVNDAGAGVLPAPVSAVISTRIKPVQESAYRA
jgi:uncharacterized protein